TTTAYPKKMVRGRRASAPSPTRAAEQRATTPRATAVGGIADFSAAVRLIGAGSHQVSATSAPPRRAATGTYARAAVALPPAVKLRVAASANAGIRGNTYCGNFDWLSERNTRGTITQQASRSGSRAAGARRASHAARQCFTRA